MKDLKVKQKFITMFDLNFLQKLEEASKEQINMQKQLDQVIK